MPRGEPAADDPSSTGWTNLHTRHVLRSMHRDAGTEGDREAAILAAALGIASTGALRALVERALRPYPVAYLVAARLGISVRTAFRYRSAAVTIITREIASALRAAMLPPPERALDAYALLALGRAQRRNGTHRALRAALDAFSRAIEDAPSARAYAEIADVHLAAAEALLCDPADAMRLCDGAIDAGLVLDAKEPALHAVRADVRLLWKRTPTAARSSVRAAFAHGKDVPRVCLAAARWSLAGGDLAVAEAFAHRGLRLERDARELQLMLARVLAARDAPNRAMHLVQSVLAADPLHAGARVELVRLRLAVERYAEARELLRALLAEEPRTSYAALSAYVDAREGRRSAAVRFLDGSGTTLLLGHVAHYLRAYAFIGLGEHAKAIHELRLAVRRGEPCAAFVHLDAVFAALRSNATFERLRAA